MTQLNLLHFKFIFSLILFLIILVFLKFLNFLVTHLYCLFIQASYDFLLLLHLSKNLTVI